MVCLKTCTFQLLCHPTVCKSMIYPKNKTKKAQILFGQLYIISSLFFNIHCSLYQRYGVGDIIAQDHQQLHFCIIPTDWNGRPNETNEPISPDNNHLVSCLQQIALRRRTTSNCSHFGFTLSEIIITNHRQKHAESIFKSLYHPLIPDDFC